MNLWRISSGIALNRSPESRWRQISVMLSTFLFVALLLGAASIIAMRLAEDHRAAGQVAVLSSVAAPSDVFILKSDDEWRGSTIELIFVEPGRGSPLPQGLLSWPRPGESAVSPALSRLIDRSPGLAQRYPGPVVMAPAGVRTGGDLLAYRVLKSGTLSADDSALHVRNGSWVGEGPVVRVSDFGQHKLDAQLIGLISPSTGSLVEIGTGLLVGLVLPGLVVLAVGLSTGSAMRTHRFDVLRALGASPAVRRRIATRETLILAAPGALLATVGWAVAGRLMQDVPIVGHRVFPGDLALPWWALLGCLVSSMIVVGLVSISSAALRGFRFTSPRPTGGRPLLSKLALAPAFVAVAAFAAGKIIGGKTDADLIFVGTAAAIIATPLLMPAMVRSAGAVLAASNSPIRSLVGHGMAWDPARAGRPFVGLAAALVLMLAATGYLGLAQFTEVPAGLNRGPQAVAVEWRGAGPGALSRHAGQLDALVVPYASAETTQGPESQVTIAASCAQLATVVGGGCQPSAPYDISSQAKQRLVMMLEPLGISHAPLTDLRLVPAEEMAITEEAARGQALVLAVRPLDIFDEQVRNVAVAGLPSAKVTSLLQSVQTPSPLVPWIKGGLLVALSAMVVACLLSLVDRLLAVRRQHLQLVSIGASPRHMTALGGWLFSAPYAVVCLASGATGVLICSLIVRPIVPVPWRTVWTILAFVLLSGLLAALSTMLASTKAMPATRD